MSDIEPDIIDEPYRCYITTEPLPVPVGWLIVSESKCKRILYRIGLYQKPNAIRRWILRYVLGFGYEDGVNE